MNDVTLGIDLAAQSKKTAACAIEWRPEGPAVMFCAVGRLEGAELDDKTLLALLEGRSALLPAAPAKVAIDAPFGWPVAFVRAMSDPVVFAEAFGSTRRSRLERRRTDHWVHKQTDKQPLSVTTDRIAYCAMRTAGLLAALQGEDDGAEVVDRTGITGRVCEAYPDPALARLGLRAEGKHPTYKGKGAEAQRETLVHALRRDVEMTQDVASLCVATDDALDALICALIARATAEELTSPPPSEVLAEARTEGWIHLPVRGTVISDLL